MNLYELASIILTLAVIIGYINQRFIKMQSTIAIMVGSLLLSVFFLAIQHFGLADIADSTKALLIRTDFHTLLINGMLSYLLFAGALSIDLSLLKSKRWEIGILASLSTISSAALIGAMLFYLLPLLGLTLPLIYCLLFGALISPTDPIAVLSTFKKLNAPKSMEICVSGESLFNDGVGIVLFLTLFQLAFQHIPITIQNISLLFLEQALGGLLYGLLLGLAAQHLIYYINERKMAILLTVAVVSGGYSLALALNISGPLAMVVAGIVVGNQLRKHASSSTYESLHVFWEVIDELLNAVLFLLIGFELLTINLSIAKLSIVLLVIPLVLLVRLLTVSIPMKLISLKKSTDPYTISILTWGGLRGGLAVALAISLPPSLYRDHILIMTYGVVIFSVIIQGLSMQPLVNLAKKAMK